MGLFDFFKTAGDDKGHDKEDVVEVSPERVDQLRQQAITEQLAKLDIEGEQVTVSVTGEIVTLTGSAPSQEALEKMVLCAGNHYGIGQVDCRVSVDAPAQVAAVAPPPAAGSGQTAAPAEAQSTFYTVESGDTLGMIAAQYYGDASKYPLIFNANRSMLSDPGKIYPGQALRIPPLVA